MRQEMVCDAAADELRDVVRWHGDLHEHRVARDIRQYLKHEENSHRRDDREGIGRDSEECQRRRRVDGIACELGLGELDGERHKDRREHIRDVDHAKRGNAHRIAPPLRLNEFYDSPKIT